MVEVILRIGRSILSDFGQKVASAMRSEIIQNLLVLEATNHLEILDHQGKSCYVTRSRRYATRWTQPDFLTSDRISVGPSGIITSLKVIEPEGLQYEVLEGGVGQRHVGFRMRAPNMRPNYLIRDVVAATVTIGYDTQNAYTYEEEPMSWVFRFPRSKALPNVARFRLSLPNRRPMLAEPRTYHISDLAKAEAARTDLSLDESEAWERLQNPSRLSNVNTNDTMTSLVWTIKPSKVNTALKLEWDWWQDRP